MRVGVVGTGAFGRNHARVYRDLQADPLLNVKFVGVVDADMARAKSVAAEFGAQAFGSVAELIAAGWTQCLSRSRPSLISPSPAS